MTRVLQLGQDHLEYGHVASDAPSATAAWAISIGATADTPSAWAKDDPSCANEDGLLLVEDGARVLLAVADGHFGRAASHAVLHELEARLGAVPRDAAALDALLAAMAPRAPDTRAGTSFLVAICDRTSGFGCGRSFFDSTFALLGPRGHRRPLQRRRAGPIYLRDGGGFEPRAADTFTFTAEPGDLLLAYTDGVDCCHYDHPATSVTPRHMEQLLAATGAAPLPFLQALVHQAMSGVDGHPGGQDNIAAVAVLARAPTDERTPDMRRAPA